MRRAAHLTGRAVRVVILRFGRGGSRSPALPYARAVSGPEKDVFGRAAVGVWYAATFATPLIVVRIAGFTIADFLFLSCIPILLVASRPRNRMALAWPLAAVLAYIAGWVAATYSVDQSENWLTVGRLVYLWLVWRWQARSLFDRPRFVGRTLTAYLVGCAASSLAAVLQITQSIYILGSEPAGLFGQRAPGLGQHVNDQGGQLAIAICIGAGLIVMGERRGRRLIILCTALNAVGLLLSGTVTGMTAAGVGVLYLVTRAHIPLRRVITVGVASAAVVNIALLLQGALTGSDPLARFQSATGSNGDTSTLGVRLQTWDYAWASIQENPFVGVGLDAESGATFNGETLTHNIFLLYLYQGGLILFAALLVTLGPALKHLFRRGPWPAVEVAVAGGMVAAIVYAQTAPVMYQRYFWLPVLLLHLLSANRKAANDPKPRLALTAKAAVASR